MKSNFNRLYKMIMEDVDSYKWHNNTQAKITQHDWEEVRKELEPYFIDHMKKIYRWREGKDEWNKFLLKDLGDTDPARDYLNYNWKEWDRETLKNKWMKRINQINGKWIEKLSLPFDIKYNKQLADEAWKGIQSIPDNIKNMDKEEVEESMQNIIKAIEKDSDWKKGADGKWEYRGYHTAAEAIAEICKDALEVDISYFEDYWEASDEVARLEYIEENGDDEDFEVDETGCGYDEWITEFDEYINVGWLKDFLDSIIDW